MRVFMVALLVLIWASPTLADEVVARIHFQPAGATVPTGYSVDSGALFSAARGHGWDGATQAKARSGFSPLLATYVSVKNGSTTTWELVLANGDYLVTLVCGGPVFRGRHTVSIEGTQVLKSVETYQGNVEVTDHAVTITDGRLTIEAGDPVAGRKTKFQYLIVTSTDGTAPPANTPPTVSTTADTTSGDAPLVVTFTTIAADAEGAISSVAWTFGDGNTATNLNPTHTYDNAGTYEAKVVVTDEGGLTAEATVTITVNGGVVPPTNTPPTVSTVASAASGDAPFAVTFTTTADDDEGPISSVAWTFGDGDTATTLNPSHTYTDAGTYEAKIVVTDAGGLTAEATVTIIVNEAGEPPPPPPPPGDGESRYNFQPPGSAPSGYAVDTGQEFLAARGFGWSDGVENKKRNFHSDALRDTYCFVKNGSPETWELAIVNGSYEVTLVCGSPQWTGKHTVKIEGATVIDTVVTASSEFVEVLKHPVTVNDGRLSIQIGGSSSGKKTKLCYVIVHGTDGSTGGGDPTGEPPTVTAAGSPLTGDAPLTVAFTGTGEDTDGTVGSYTWVLGDGSTSTNQNPSHIYQSPGTYVATVTVADDAGNTAQASLTITVTGEEPPAPPPPGLVTASVETPPVVSVRDAADDPAVWVHPDDPALSVVIGTDKDAGYLFGYDLTGVELWRVHHPGQPNNVDVRGNLVGCSLSSTLEMAFYQMDPETRTLTKLGEIDVGVDSAYGFTFYVSPTSGKLYAFVSGRRHDIEQYEIQTNPLSATLVRELDTAKGEGMAADEETGKLFMVEETVGLFVYDAEPTGGQTRTQIGSVGSSILAGELEGVTIYYAANDKGYVIVSDQGPGRYVIFNRTAPYAYVGTFKITSHPDAPGPGAHDGTSETDGIHVLNLPLGDDFPFGVFVAQDGSNTKPQENQNFKFVPWERIADLLGLEKDTTFVPGE